MREAVRPAGAGFVRQVDLLSVDLGWITGAWSLAAGADTTVCGGTSAVYRAVKVPRSALLHRSRSFAGCDGGHHALPVEHTDADE